MADAMPIPDCWDIEIVERSKGPIGKGAHGIVVPNQVRIDGKPVLMPAGHPVIVHPIDSKDDLNRAVKVTLTVFARTVSIRHELEPTTDESVA